MDPDVLTVHDLFRHVYPDFTLNHVLVYRRLWRIEPISGEKVADETNLSKTSTYKILAELVAAGLVKRTSFKPIGYYAENPVKTYYACMQKIVSKLKKGKEQLREIIDNSTGLSNEEYLIKLDGGQTKLISMQTHEPISDGEKLKEYRDGLDNKLKEIEHKKLKAWQLIGKA
jgi:predicted transcriptional regulator